MGPELLFRAVLIPALWLAPLQSPTIEVKWQDAMGFRISDGVLLQHREGVCVAYARSVLPTRRARYGMHLEARGGWLKLLARDPRVGEDPYHHEFLREVKDRRVDERFEAVLPEDCEIFLYSLGGRLERLEVTGPFKDKPAFRPTLRPIAFKGSAYPKVAEIRALASNRTLFDVSRVVRRGERQDIFLDCTFQKPFPAKKWLLCAIDPIEVGNLLDGARCNSRAPVGAKPRFHADAANAFAALAWGGYVGPPGPEDKAPATSSYEVGYLHRDGGAEIRSIHFGCPITSRVRATIALWNLGFEKAGEPPGHVLCALDPPPVSPEFWQDMLRAVLSTPVRDEVTGLYLQPLAIQYTRFNEPDRPPYSLIVDFLYLYPDGRVGAALSLFCPQGRRWYLFEPARLTPHHIAFAFPRKSYVFEAAPAIEKVYDGYLAQQVEARAPAPVVDRLSLHSVKAEPPQSHRSIIRAMERAGCGEPGMGQWCHAVPVYATRIRGRPYSVWFWHLRRIAEDPNISTVIEEDPAGGYTVHVGRHLCGPLVVRAGDGRTWRMGPNICGKWNRSAEGYLRFHVPPQRSASRREGCPPDSAREQAHRGDQEIAPHVGGRHGVPRAALPGP